MTVLLLGLGSNIDPEKHLITAAAAIRSKFEDVKFSCVYRSKAVGMDGDDFLNACCLIANAPEHADFVQWCKRMEDHQGRDRSKGSWKPRTIDLDILMYADQVLDDDLYRYAHVFVPASELIACKATQQMDASAVQKVDLVL